MILIKFQDVKMNYIDIMFTFTILRNDKVLLTGINGKGKSTIGKLILKFFKPDEGLITNNCRSIGYLNEKINLPLNMKVVEYLNSITKIYKTNIDYTLVSLLNLKLDSKIKTLSKGNKQKLAIITTLISNHDLYILDEPLNGLDDNTINNLIRHLKVVNYTLLIITHYPEKYENVATRIISI